MGTIAGDVRGDVREERREEGGFEELVVGGQLEGGDRGGLVACGELSVGQGTACNTLDLRKGGRADFGESIWCRKLEGCGGYTGDSDCYGDDGEEMHLDNSRKMNRLGIRCGWFSV